MNVAGTVDWDFADPDNSRQNHRKRPVRRSGIVARNTSALLDDLMLNLFTPRDNDTLEESRFVSHRDLEQNRIKRKLSKAIDYLNHHGLEVEEGQFYKASDTSAEAAKLFINSLSSRYLLPKIAPEEDGEITLVWRTQHASIDLVLSNWELYTVLNPGTNEFEELPPLRFDGENIPKAIIDRLPTN